jgi:hypothetical protein
MSVKHPVRVSYRSTPKGEGPQTIADRSARKIFSEELFNSL